jgi:hypothetical protein
LERIRFKGWVSSNAIEGGTATLHILSTPKGSYQWKVLVMGLKNGFKRMMEWVLSDIDNEDPYVDDIIIGSTGKNWEDFSNTNRM